MQMCKPFWIVIYQYAVESMARLRTSRLLKVYEQGVFANGI